MLVSPGALLKYEVDYSLCQEGLSMEGASLPAVMDLQFLTGASLFNQPMPSYSALYPSPSPVLPSSVVGLQQASMPWTVGMLPTPASTLSPVALQVRTQALLVAVPSFISYLSHSYRLVASRAFTCATSRVKLVQTNNKQDGHRSACAGSASRLRALLGPALRDLRSVISG